jgi:hypothetical protein
MTKTLAYYGMLKGFVTQALGTVFTTHHFPRNLQMGPYKIECYITLDWKSLPGINTPAYCAHLKVMEKMKCCV